MCRPYWPHGDRGNRPNPLQCNGFGRFICYMIHPSRIPAIAAFAFISSLCTISTLAIWPNRPSRSKTPPAVPMLSVTGPHCRCLEVSLFGCPWIRDYVPYVLHSSDVLDGPFKAKTKAGVWNRSVLPKVKVPPVVLFPETQLSHS